MNGASALCLLASALLGSWHQAAQAGSSQPGGPLSGEPSTQQQPIMDVRQDRFDALRRARDEDYLRLRQALFEDAQDVAALRERFSDSDPVARFIARQLHDWATIKPAEFTATERFIQVEEPLLRKSDRTAAGGGGSTALLKKIASLPDPRRAVDYLLLRTLMQPRQPDWIYGALLRYFAEVPLFEPEVWIRIALERRDDAVFDNLAEYSLRTTNRAEIVRALQGERVRSRALKLVFPKQFDLLMSELRKSHS